MKISLAFSPCPNDTFIFDALIHHKIDTEGLEFEVHLADVEELNSSAFQKEYDISKLSFNALLKVVSDYQLLNSGSALGSGVGPLLIAKRELSESQIDQARVAIPGKNTTANFLLSAAYPRLDNKVEMLFSDIEDAVLEERVDAGLIIHENRFTYQQKGLISLIDLGNYWEEKSGNLIPLGGIAIRRTLDNDLKAKVDRLIRKSIEYAFQNPDSSREYIKNHSQEMDDEVIRQHIELYVNQYSIDLGKEGKEAVNYLFEEAVKQQIIGEIPNDIFVKK